MSPGEIKIGMHFVNQGPGAISVYDNLDGTGTPMLSIAPGQEIGQVVDIRSGAGGTVIIFISDPITSAAPLYEKFLEYSVGWLVDTVRVGGAVRYDNFAANVSDAQVQSQAQAIATAEANGHNFANSVKEVVGNITDVIGAAIPWTPILILGGIFLLGPTLLGKAKSKIRTAKPLSWKHAA